VMLGEHDGLTEPMWRREARCRAEGADFYGHLVICRMSRG
jgi:hypothetical protein